MRHLRNIALLAALTTATWLPVGPVGFDRPLRSPNGPATPAVPNRVCPVLQDQLDARLEQTERESLERIEAQLGPVRQLFAQARQGARSFAEELLGLGSKWSWLVDRLPLTRGNCHEDRVRETFARHVPDAEEMARMVELATSARLAEWAQARRSL